MGIGIKELIIILVIVMLLFGTKEKIKGIGSDVGGWIRDFRKAIKDGNEEPPVVDVTASKRVIDGDAVPSPDQKNT